MSRDNLLNLVDLTGTDEFCVDLFSSGLSLTDLAGDVCTVGCWACLMAWFIMWLLAIILL